MAVNVNGQPISALLNSGSTVTLAHPTALGPPLEPKGLVPDVSMDARHREDPMSSSSGPRPCSGSDDLLTSRQFAGFLSSQCPYCSGGTGQVNQATGHEKPATRNRVQPACMAQEDGDMTGRASSGETLVPSNTVSCVSPGCSGGEPQARKEGGQ